MVRFLRAILIFQLAGIVFSNLCLSSEDTFPSKPITVIVPFAAGGGSDVFVRIFQDSIRRNKLCPQPIVVKNISGAGGTIGSRTAREAEPDGHTILCLHDGIYTAQHYGNADWGPADFEPIAATRQSGVEGNVKNQAKAVDQASAALVQDLKRLGMLEDTLVVWGGEFGRTPMVEASAALNRSGGRDHHPEAFTMWMAGGGTKPGITVGKTDELGFHVTEDPVHVHDLQATILKLMGIDHTQLSFRFQGLDFRLTGVEPHHPVRKLMI